MLEAKSMYFGGEIISASECDYESSRNLGLICPFCSSAVFIRSESTRQTRGKIQLVRPYFAHYPSGSDENWDCERRSRSKQGKEEIEQLKITARNQRLRLYNAYLWEMIASDRNISHQKLNKVRSLFGERWCEERSVLTRHEWSKSLDSVYTFIDSAIYDMQHNDPLAPGGRPPLMDEKTYREEYEKQNAYILGCDQRLHRAICFEVADFLATNTGGFAFQKIFKTCIFLEVLYLPSLDVKRAEPRTHIVTIAAFIAGTHWNDQINKRLEVST